MVLSFHSVFSVSQIGIYNKLSCSDSHNVLSLFSYLRTLKYLPPLHPSFYGPLCCDLGSSVSKTSLVAQTVCLQRRSACSAGDQGSIPEWGRSPGEGNVNHSGILPWKIYGWRSLPGYSSWVAKSWTRLKDVTFLSFVVIWGPQSRIQIFVM